MRILLVSKEGNALDMALRYQREGCEVRLAIPEVKPEEKEYMAHFGEGLVERVDDYLAYARKADLAVCDDSALDDQMHELKKLGIPVFGTCYGNPSETGKWELGGKLFRGHQAAHLLEKERAVVHHVLNELKVGQHVESLSFKDIGEAVAHLKDHPVPHVIKPETDGSGGSKTYVSELEDGRDGIGWLETLVDRGDAPKSIEVEEKISGVEAACSLWSAGKGGFVGPLNVNFEHKRIWTGNIGPNCGEQGTLMFYDRRPFKRVKMFQETLAKLEGLLATLDYRGQMDVNGIVNQDGFHATELTPRLGYPSSYIEDTLQVTPWSELHLALAQGKAIDNKVRPGYAMGVVVFAEKYPDYNAAFEVCNGLPFYPETKAGLDKALDFFHPCDVRVQEGRVVLNGCYAGCVTARASTILECQQQIYDGILNKKEPRIFFPGMAYRNDIGNKTEQDMQKLKSWGYDFLI